MVDSMTMILVKNINGIKTRCSIHSRLLDELPLSVLTVASEIEDGEDIDLSMGPVVLEDETFLDALLSAYVGFQGTPRTRDLIQLMPKFNVQADTNEYTKHIHKIRAVAVVMEWQAFLQLGTLDAEMMHRELQDTFDLVDHVGINSIQGKLRDHIQGFSASDATRLLLKLSGRGILLGRLGFCAACACSHWWSTNLEQAPLYRLLFETGGFSIRRS